MVKYKPNIYKSGDLWLVIHGTFLLSRRTQCEGKTRDQNLCGQKWAVVYSIPAQKNKNKININKNLQIHCMVPQKNFIANSPVVFHSRFDYRDLQFFRKKSKSSDRFSRCAPCALCVLHTYIFFILFFLRHRRWNTRPIDLLPPSSSPLSLSLAFSLFWSCNCHPLRPINRYPDIYKNRPRQEIRYFSR